MKTLNIIAAITATAIIAMAGCSKENSDPGSGYMAVQMSEASSGGSTASSTSLFSSVNVDIAHVDVHYADEAEGNGGWITLNTNAGVYDLMTLQNDVTTVLAENTKLPAGHITQIRLVLGLNNSLVLTGGGEYTLTVPGASETGIKINVETSVEKDKHLTISLDFDAAASITVKGNGTFALKPVISIESITSTKM